MNSRPLYLIAEEIKANWLNLSPHALPYVEAMAQLNTIKDQYYADTAYGVVSYFLANAGGWRGDTARKIKAELKSLI
jgi:hypothetical protein